MDPDGGVMLTFFPDILPDRKKAFEWVERINSAQVGLSLKYDTPHGYDSGQYVLMVTRNQSQNPSFDPEKKQHYARFSEEL